MLAGHSVEASGGPAPSLAQLTRPHTNRGHMLPSRAYANSLPAFSPGGPVRETATAAVLLAATGPATLDQFSVSSFTRVAAHNTADALHAVERVRPRVT